MSVFSLEPETAYSDAAKSDVVESRGETPARCVAGGGSLLPVWESSSWGDNGYMG